MIVKITHTDYEIKSDGQSVICNGFTDGEARLCLKEILEATTFYGKSVFRVEELGIIAQKILKKFKIDWEYSYITLEE